MHSSKISKMPNNVLGTPLIACCFDPMTGYFRDGRCNTNAMDTGRHLVCAIMTDEFLQFSQERGNDLITPRPEYQFPGLKAGDGWCLCALRWREAYDAGLAPPVKLEATHEYATQFIPFSALLEHKLDPDHPKSSKPSNNGSKSS